MEMGVFDIFRENIIEATDNMAMPDNEIPNFLFEVREGGKKEEGKGGSKREGGA